MVPIEIKVIVGVLCFWTVIAIVLAIAINNCLRPENRGIYPHPVVGLIIDNQTDHRIGPAAKIWTPILFTILLLPITIECFVLWCGYKVWKAFNKKTGLINKEPIQIEFPKYEPEVKEAELKPEEIEEYEKSSKDIITTFKENMEESPDDRMTN